MRKTSNGGFAIGGGSSSGDADPSWVIPDGDGVSTACKPDI